MNKNQPKRRGLHPVMFALAVAVFGVLAMLIVDHRQVVQRQGLAGGK